MQKTLVPKEEEGEAPQTLTRTRARTHTHTHTQSEREVTSVVTTALAEEVLRTRATKLFLLSDAACWTA